MALAVLPALVASSCDGGASRQAGKKGSTTSGPVTSGPVTSATASPGSTTSAAAPAGTDWTTYQRDAARSGSTPEAIDPTRLRRQWTSPELDGDVYAQPLLVGDQVIVATEGDSVYSLDGATGAVRWRANLGVPVPGGDLPCGNIDPLGILGTPVIDPGAKLVYAVAFTKPFRYELVALDLTSGAVRSRTRVDVPGSDPAVQSQRAALALALGAGRVYVAFGGRFGDCGDYRGRVTGVSTTGGEPVSFSVRAKGAGIWAPGGPVVDSDGTVLVATGNGDGNGRALDTDSVLRLSAELQPTDAFVPDDWERLNTADLDLGSISPTPLAGHLVFQAGKDGVGYLLDGTHLGGTGGQLHAGKVCPEGGAYGADALAGTVIFVPCETALVAVRVDPAKRSFAVDWRFRGINAGPPIVTGSTVWVVSIDDGALLALDAVSGKRLTRVELGAVTHFATLAAGHGHLVVPAGRKVVAFAAS